MSAAMMMYVIDHETSMKKPVYDKYGDKTHKAKEILKEAKETGAMPPGATDYFGYGICVGRKPVINTR